MALNSSALQYFLATEFLLGGQCRLTPIFTPSMHAFVMSKANHFFDHLRFIPGSTPQQQMQAIGAVMCVAGAWLASPGFSSSTSRKGSLLLGGSLSTLLFIGEYTVGGQVWLPVINVALAGWVMYKEGQREEL